MASGSSASEDGEGEGDENEGGEGEGDGDGDGNGNGNGNNGEDEDEDGTEGSRRAGGAGRAARSAVLKASVSVGGKREATTRNPSDKAAETGPSAAA